MTNDLSPSHCKGRPCARLVGIARRNIRNIHAPRRLALVSPRRLRRDGRPPKHGSSLCGLLGTGCAGVPPAVSFRSRPTTLDAPCYCPPVCSPASACATRLGTWSERLKLPICKPSPTLERAEHLPQAPWASQSLGFGPQRFPGLAVALFSPPWNVSLFEAPCRRRGEEEEGGGFQVFPARVSLPLRQQDTLRAVCRHFRATVFSPPFLQGVGAYRPPKSVCIHWRNAGWTVATD